jgi:glucose-6-phosphate 1-dehydrogenase
MAARGDVVPSDALVLFGATGDLAYKRIFPAVWELHHEGRLDLPVVGVSSSKWPSASTTTPSTTPPGPTCRNG